MTAFQCNVSLAVENFAVMFPRRVWPWAHFISSVTVLLPAIVHVHLFYSFIVFYHQYRISGSDSQVGDNSSKPMWLFARLKTHVSLRLFCFQNGILLKGELKPKALKFYVTNWWMPAEFGIHPCFVEKNRDNKLCEHLFFIVSLQLLLIFWLAQHHSTVLPCWGKS